MIDKQSQQSILDFLTDIMPQLGPGDFSVLIKPIKSKDPNADKLYGLWSDAANRISARKFKQPPNMSDRDVRKLEASGFVEIQGKDLKITEKGVRLIREMILDDDDCYFSKAASDNRMKKMATVQEQNSKNWYKRLKNAYSVS